MTLLPPNLTIFLVHFALNLSPICLFTLFFPSFPNELNLLSSLKNTFAQFSYVQITYLFANSNFFFLFFELTSGFFLGVRLNSPISCSHLETVYLDTLTHEVLFITLLISVQDLKRSFDDIRCIIRSSLAEVLRGSASFKSTNYFASIIVGFNNPAYNTLRTFHFLWNLSNGVLFLV